MVCFLCGDSVVLLDWLLGWVGCYVSERCCGLDLVVLLYWLGSVACF